MSSEQKKVTTYPALVGKVLAIQRESLEIDQVDLAGKMGLTQSSWSRVERGVATINSEQLNKAANLLNTTAGNLLNDADQLKKAFEQQGGVIIDKKEAESLSPTMKLVGAAALGALLFAIVRNK